MNHGQDSQRHPTITRRSFIRASSVAATAVTALPSAFENRLAAEEAATRYRFVGPDSLCHGPGWDSLNPGYWQIKSNALRRRLTNYRAPDLSGVESCKRPMNSRV